jgi:hypothetical protein
MPPERRVWWLRKKMMLSIVFRHACGRVFGLLQVEKAQDAINEEDAAAMMKKMLSSKFDFNDFLGQYKSVNKMGSLGSVLKMIPGLSGVDDKQLVEVEKKYIVYESIIQVSCHDAPYMNTPVCDTVVLSPGWTNCRACHWLHCSCKCPVCWRC